MGFRDFVRKHKAVSREAKAQVGQGIADRRERKRFNRIEKLGMLKGKMELRQEEVSTLRSEIKVRKQIRRQKEVMRQVKRERFRDSNVGKVSSIISSRLKKRVTRKTMTRKKGRIMSRHSEQASPNITINLSTGGQVQRTTLKRRKRPVRKSLPNPEFNIFGSPPQGGTL